LQTTAESLDYEKETLEAKAKTLESKSEALDSRSVALEPKRRLCLKNEHFDPKKMEGPNALSRYRYSLQGVWST